jgi:hypothetical protein
MRDAPILTLVIPAQAGIQRRRLAKPLDPRFRGDDMIRNDMIRNDMIRNGVIRRVTDLSSIQ